MNNTKNSRRVNAFELYYQRDGQKKSVLCNSLTELNRKKMQILRNKRKYLGSRPVVLVEA